MSIIYELGIVICISFLGVGISAAGNLPIPGSVLAMIIFYCFLERKVIKVEKIGRVCDFLGANMALFFIPLNVGLMASYKLFADKAVILVVTVILSTFIGVLCSYAGVVMVGKLMKRRKGNGHIQ